MAHEGDPVAGWAGSDDAPGAAGLGALLRKHWGFVAPVAAFSVGTNLIMLAAPLFSMQIYDRVLPTRSGATLLVLTGLILGLSLANALLDAVRGRLMVQLATAVASSFERRTLPLSLVPAAAGGSDPRSDVDSVRRLLAGPVMLGVFDAPWSLLFLAVIWTLHPFLGVLACCGAVVILIVSGVLGARAHRVARAARRLQRRESEQIQELRADSGAALAMGGALAIERRLLSSQADRCLQELRAGYAAVNVRSFGRNLRSAMQLGALAVAAWLAIGQEVPPGAIIAVSLLLTRTLSPIERVAGSWPQLAEGRAALRRLSRLEQSADAGSRTTLPAVRGRLSISGLAFRHQSRDRFLFKGLGLTMEPGEALAVVGATAAGKSSFCRMLAGLETPSTGEIRVDGASLAAWSREQWGASIGFVPQEFVLLGGTVAENIARYGRVDSEAVIGAAQLVGAHEQILQLPDAYETRLGSGGVRLSRGEQQLIGLARAFYGRPSFIILDEPAYHLDDAGERALVHALHRLKGDGATIVLASRVAGLLHVADHLLMLRRGQPPAFKAHAGVANLLRPRVAASGPEGAAGAPAAAEA